MTITIAVIDDDELDFIGLKRAFTKMNAPFQLTHLKDGQEALEALHARSIPHPHILILDLNMPRMDGHEFLEIIRNDDLLKSSVVFVLTTSNNNTDIVRAHEKNVAGYIVKEHDGFADSVELINQYLKVIKFPAHD